MRKWESKSLQWICNPLGKDYQRITNPLERVEEALRLRSGTGKSPVPEPVEGPSAKGLQS